MFVNIEKKILKIREFSMRNLIKIRKFYNFNAENSKPVMCHLNMQTLCPIVPNHNHCQGFELTIF